MRKVYFWIKHGNQIENLTEENYRYWRKRLEEQKSRKLWNRIMSNINKEKNM